MKKARKFRKWVMLPAILVLAAFMLAGQTQGAVDAPFEALWTESGHADAAAEAFVHWDDDGEVQTSCAKCHSSGGFQDFLDNGVVDAPAAIGTTVDCVACHNTNTAGLSTVTFPSGAEVTGLGGEARCITCHQGRESTVSVDAKIADAGLADDDTPGLGFRNVHYMAAGATQYGGVVKGGYQYAGKMYDTKFAHVKDVDSCIDCHDPHSLDVKLSLCNQCHEDTLTEADLKNIRYKSSDADYDGDGETAEGIAGEVETLTEILYAAIQANAAAIGSPVGYESHSYPYWFKDTNEDGVIDPATEAGYSNGYKFTARLLKAAYNYQFAMKDHGAYAHNAKYLIQLLHDSIEDLDPAMAVGLTRDDSGHFEGVSEAFRHWDGGDVSANCSKCHTATGLPHYLETGVTAAQAPSNGLECTTCHAAMPPTEADPKIYDIAGVEFPSGLSAGFGEDDKVSNICMTCHQGRESTASVNASIANMPLDGVSSSLRFKNSHYFPAGATLFGSDAKTAYEYPGKTYKGQRSHASSLSDNLNACHECHDSHKPELAVHNGCTGFCHNGSGDPKEIRLPNTPDYDGDGDTTEGIAGEIDTLHHALMDAIQAYALAVGGEELVYQSGYPYFVSSTGGSYKKYTPRLIQATYNYQFVKKDPGAFAHNPRYIIQILHDSLASLAEVVNIDMDGMVRPDDAGATLPACGDVANPAPIGDFNGDCRVDLYDLSVFSSKWLTDLNPQ
ncbi:MAG: hypothetical protein K9M75_03200 [Phycisphaerae bacterium]|nr:hypothetical protein [Phycisphaerae bacterium]